MQIAMDRADASSLEALAIQATQLLAAGKFIELAQSFGYAVSLGREPVAAIESDLTSALIELGASGLASEVQPQIEVRFFKPGQLLFAVVECILSTNNGRQLLVEFVVTEQGSHGHVSLEQISAAA